MPAQGWIIHPTSVYQSRPLRQEILSFNLGQREQEFHSFNLMLWDKNIIKRKLHKTKYMCETDHMIIIWGYDDTDILATFFFDNKKFHYSLDGTFCIHPWQARYRPHLRHVLTGGQLGCHNNVILSDEHYAGYRTKLGAQLQNLSMANVVITHIDLLNLVLVPQLTAWAANPAMQTFYG